MRISQAFPSRYLRAADLHGPTVCTVRTVRMEKVGQDSKPVVYFDEVKSGFVVNATNARRLAASLGDETDNWCGRQVTLDVEQVEMRGQLVPAIRAHVDGAFMAERRPPTAKESAAAAQRPLDPLDDEIPF